MPKKINLSQKKKDHIRYNFHKIDKSNLSKEEQRYYTLVNNGKQSAKKNVRFEGQYLSRKSELYKIVEKVADKKGLDVQTYLDTNKDHVEQLVEQGATTVFKRVDSAIDITNDLSRKTVLVDTGNGIVRMSKNDAIEKMALFQQYVASNSSIVMISTKMKTFLNGKVGMTIPDPEDYEGLEGEELENFLDQFDDLHYIVSAKKAA